MAIINTKEKALNKIEEIRNNKNVEIGRFYNSEDESWDYYFSVCGWFNGNYFQLYFTSYEGNSSTEIPSHVTEKKTLFKKQFKIS